MRRALLPVISALLVLTACTSQPPQAPPPPPIPAEAVIGQTVIPGSKAPSGNMVPDVVGENHQEAQDSLQAAGFYKLKEEDATGKDRSLIIDRNWVVVEQIPKAGSVLDPKQTVTLKSKKYTD